ncbi:MAG: glycosyltransferase [Myxococcales bacterium]|nr:glycosyltransferase [Myxococcales bacterium]
MSADGIQVDGSATKRSLVAQGFADEQIATKPMVPQNIEDFFAAKPDPKARDELTDGGRFSRVLLFVGRIAEQKDLGLLLQCVASLRGRWSGLRLVLIGEGPERPALESRSRSLGLKSSVRWLGPRPHREVPRYVGSCDVFVLSSRYEGFARVLMEAAAAARAIVTTAVSGADDAVIDGETGYIVPIGDGRAFAGAVERLIDDGDLALRMGRRGQENLRQVARRYLDPKLQIEIWRAVVGRWRATQADRGRR